MFDLEKNKKFKDAIHGYIEVPVIFVEEIIDTPLFQRLRFIEQTGIRRVYPSARHDRFIHSLGTFYLGTKAVDALLLNFKSDKYWNIYSDDIREIFWAKSKILFLIACLLHDIGHAPFSHSLEHFYINDETKNNLQNYFNEELCNEFYDGNTDKLIPQPHELASAVITITKFKNNISNILDKLNKENYPYGKFTLVSEHGVFPKPVDNKDIDDDLIFIVRMITGIPYKDYIPEKQIRNCFISLLNGKNFDVDKLDYIIRDSKMSGFDNIQLDITRLLSSLVIIPVTKCCNYVFGKGKKNEEFKGLILKAFTKKNQKFKLLGSNFQGRIDIANGNICIENKSKIEKLNGSLNIIESSALPEFTSDSEIYDMGRKLTPINNKITLNYHGLHELIINKSKNVNNFEFICTGSIVVIENLIGSINIENGDFDITSTTNLEGELNGIINEMEVLQDLLEEKNIIPSEEMYNSFHIGFTNQALSIIKNIDIARNYLYLWIYAHHKVVYYSNFLIPELMRKATKIIGKTIKDFINISDIDDIDDICITSIFRNAYKVSDKNNIEYCDFLKLYNEYKSRKYRKSLFKSIADYDLFFINLTQNEKNKLKGILLGNERYLYLGDSAFYDKIGVESILCIDVNLSIKEIDPGKTYISYNNNNEVHTMDQLSALSVKTTPRDNPYFYIYYSLKENINFDIKNFKNEMIEWFKNKLDESDRTTY